MAPPSPPPPAAASRPRPSNRSKYFRRHSLTLPERLRTADDDEGLDVTAPKTRRGRMMNQSFVSMIANMGSNTKFASHMSSAFEPIQEAQAAPGDASTAARPQPSLQASDAEHDADHDNDDSTESDPSTAPATPRLQPKVTPQLPDNMSTSQILAPPVRHPARSAQLDPGLPTPALHSEAADAPADALDAHDHRTGKVSEQQEPLLAGKIAQIFNFDHPEEVIAEYQCALLQSVLLDGYMYITEKHVCFFAYLPKRSNKVAKSGWLLKRGRQNPKYNRYWFQLKGDSLAYYNDQSGGYFPRGIIDLRAALSVETVPSRSSAEPLGFVINAAQQKHQFRAESTSHTEKWTQLLQKIVFRSHNDGDSVKICLPIDNLLDVEEAHFLQAGTAVRLKIIDNDETYALDEYFFSFSDFGNDAIALLRDKMRGNTATKEIAQLSLSGKLSEPSSPAAEPFDKPRTTFLGVATKHGRPVPGRKATFEKQRAGHDDDSSTQASADTARAGSSYGRPSLDESCPTASQVLQGSAIFSRPTMRPDRRSSHFKSSSSRQPIDSTRHVDHQDDADQKAAPPGVDGRSERDSAERPGSSASQDTATHGSPSSSSITGFMRAGAYPLQKASGLAGLVRNQSKRVGSLLATESKTYYEKVTGMWAGKQTHYGEAEEPLFEEDGEDRDEEKGDPRYGTNFRTHFALPDTEKLIATFYCHFGSSLPVYGKLYIGNTRVCFRSLMPGMRTKMILPLRDIENADDQRGLNPRYSGLCITIGGHEEIFFEFSRASTRDDCRVTLLRLLDSSKNMSETRFLTAEERLDAVVAKAEFDSLSESYKKSPRVQASYMERLGKSESDGEAIMFDDMDASIVDFRPPRGQRITCLTIGSRGDVQPYIALCKGLLAEGHHPKIATHAEFEPWIRSHGIDFAPVAGDPAEIMRLCIENDMFTSSFARTVISKFLGWFSELLTSSWEACQGSDILIESPSAIAGIHIAEALQIPYFRAFTMPWTRTRAYPHAFAVSNQKMGGNYNSITYTVIDNGLWTAAYPQVNLWRWKTLGLAFTTLDRMQQNKVPFLYNFSPSVVTPPLDFNHWVHVTGYWFLDEGLEWQPPRELAHFIQKARADGKKLVYIGFGSIIVEDPMALTKTIAEAVVKADVRCILSKGWTDKLAKKDATVPEMQLPPEIHQIKSAPHDWLFRQVDAAVHHGGAGTTGASLRAGIPTVIKPFFGDQYFYGQRIEDLGVGMCINRINASLLAKVMWSVTHDERIIVRARILGEKIRSENGVDKAIQTIYRELEYATDLVTRRVSRKRRKSRSSATEESWTMVDDDEAEFQAAPSLDPVEA